MTESVPESPTLPGVTWRSARVDDAAAIVVLHDACFEVEGGYRTAEAEILENWASDGCDPVEDSLLAMKDDGSVIAIAWSFVPTVATTKWRAFQENYVHPEYWATALPEFVLEWWEVRSRQRLEAKQDGLPQYLWAMAYEWQTHRTQLLESHGYEAKRYFDELERDLGEQIVPVPVPDGISIQTWESAPLSDSLLVQNQAFIDHWGSQPVSETRWAQHESEFHLSSASFVAYDGDDPVSYLMSAAYPHDYGDKGRSEAWVEGLGTIRSHRRQGIGSTLVTMAMGEFRRLGMEFAMLGVDAASPTGAHHLYESLGFVQNRRSIAYVKGISP